MRPSLRARALLLPIAVWTAACARPAPEPAVVRLVDHFGDATVEGSPAADRPPQRVEWRDGNSYGDRFEWRPGSEVREMKVEGGALVGRTGAGLALLDLERRSDLDPEDLLHAVELRLAVPEGGTLAVGFDEDDEVSFDAVRERARAFPWPLHTPLVAGEEVRTYTLAPTRPVRSRAIRHVLLQPTDRPGARFRVEGVRLVFRREHLGGIPSGVSWQGLAEIYHETLVARAPETLRFRLRLPARPRLELALGTVEEGPVGFRVAIEAGGGREIVLQRTVTTPHRWERARADLDAHGGRTVDLLLSVTAGADGALGFWGSPALRRRGGADAAPGGVILVLADTLRRDHLSLYGYPRPTSPALESLAAQGVLVDDAVAQATWTKASVPSILTSLYPGSHTVREFNDRLPASARTLAEIYREAGYATLSLASILFVGKFSNLHQGFEELHEPGSLDRAHRSKVAREYVDRLLPWLEDHRDVPFFVLLHVEDPHNPFEPYAPYDRMWADPAGAERHQRESKAVRAAIQDPLLRNFGMPTREELEQAGIDADAYVAHEIDWYDGSIRALDAEIARLVERLRELGLEERTLLAFVSDHGEEFLEHGRHFHGQSTYGELTGVPLLLRGPGVPAGVVVRGTVETIDLMPTLLELSGLEAPAGLQGRSLVPLFTGAAAEGPAARPRPAFSEKVAIAQSAGPPPRELEAFAVIEDGWKLVHVARPLAGDPRDELYDHRRDPLDLVDLAAAHPDVVARLRDRLERWRAFTEAARLPADETAAHSLTREEMEQLKSLGYIQ